MSTEETLRFVPQPSRNGRGLWFGVVMAAIALGWGAFRLATGHTADPLTWTAVVIGVLMLLITISLKRGGNTPLTFLVGPAGVGRDQPERTAFQLPWPEIRTSRLVHEHSDNTVWFEVDPARPELFRRRPEMAFFKTRTSRPEDPERYRILVNDGTDQVDAVDAALRRFGGRRYAGRETVTIKQAQETRRRARQVLRRD